jgi:hypothetical protein
LWDLTENKKAQKRNALQVATIPMLWVDHFQPLDLFQLLRLESQRLLDLWLIFVPLTASQTQAR